jgi:putative transposase
VNSKLTELTGFESYDAFRMAHRELVNDSVGNGENYRQAKWTASVAVGSKSFLEGIKDKMGVLAKGRKFLKMMVSFSCEKRLDL